MKHELTYDSYRELLLKLKEDYDFTSFSSVKYSGRDLSGKLILRHDIDLSLERAADMSDMESELGISSVYFLFLRSPFYNIFSHAGEQLIKRIIKNNHYIGLHFDYSKYMNITAAEVTHHILQEIKFMEQFFSIKLDSVSFHRPFDIEFFQRLELGLYPHAYESVFLKEFKYISDSRGLWRYGHPLDQEAFKEKKPMQILIHPIWWKKEGADEGSFSKLQEWKQEYDARFYDHAYNEMKGFWNANTHLNHRDL